MTRLKFLTAASCFCVLIVFSAFAAEEPFRIRSVSTAQPGRVSAVVELPSGLTPKPDEFELLIDNKPVATVREIRGLDLNIMFLVDISGSMKGSKNDSPLEDAKGALLNFLNDKSKRPQDRFELTPFAEKSTPLSSFDKESIESLKAAGPKTKTFLYQVLDDALKSRPKDDPQTRHIFVVISDGKDEGSEVKPDQVKQGSEDLLVPIYIVFRGKTGLDYSDTLNLNKIAEAAGGNSYPTKNAAELAIKLKQIYELEKNSRVVQFGYGWGSPERTTRDAAIKLRRPDGLALAAEFPRAIPVPLSPPPPRPFPWLLWLIAAVILCSGVAAGIWLRSKSAPVVMRAPPSEKIEPVSETDIPPSPPRRPQTTLIGQHFPAPTVGRPTAMLQGVAGPVDGQQYSVEKEIFSIGAGKDNDLSIGEDEYVSTEHAYLRYEKGSLFIFDRASRNGTFVNDDTVPQTGIVLRPGDRIKLGKSTLEVMMPAR
jgi:pSer/pThr/pTyr-binding forkhead associated (FHA) protein/Mg-chelatase subunit ChlD